MKWYSSGLFQRFIITMVLLALAPAVFMGLQLVRISRDGIQASVQELHIKLAERTASETTTYLKNIDDKMRFLLASGRPLREPVAWHGPIVMNTDEELRRAFAQYRDGTFLDH